MKSLICKLLGHRSVVVGDGHDRGCCLLCERCGHIRRANWLSAFSELTIKKAKLK